VIGSVSGPVSGWGSDCFLTRGSRQPKKPLRIQALADYPAFDTRNFETGESERAMKMSKLSMWAALTALTVSTAACSSGRDYLFEGNEYSNPIKVNTIKELYQARDACLAKNAIAADGENSDVTTIAKAVALACAPETDRLIAATNVDRDPKVAEAIRKDTDQKAAKFVVRAPR